MPNDIDKKWVQWSKTDQLLEIVAEDINRSFNLPRPVLFEVVACEEANAFWDPEMATMQLCYELLTDYADLYRQR